MSKLPMWDEREWDEKAEQAREQQPIRRLTVLPSVPGIAPGTERWLKLKSLYWMITRDHGLSVLRHVLRHPVRHARRFLTSVWKRKPYVRDGDFFLYGIRSVEEFQKQLERDDAILVVGFSYCEKPFECPEGRFTDRCRHDPANPVCRQCFIGKCAHALPEERTQLLIIPTIHYIGKRLFEIIKANPDKRVLFVITACELTLEMFGDYGNMAGVQGIGVRLDGRICNTMKAFELSEGGIKPGLTVVLPETERRIMELIACWRAQQVHSV